VTKILEITLLEAIKARAELRARSWIIKRESSGKVYIVDKRITKPLADGLINKAVNDLEEYHYKQFKKP
jgi:hypothetical protein